MGDEYIAYAYWLDNVQGIGKKKKIQWTIRIKNINENMFTIIKM